MCLGGGEGGPPYFKYGIMLVQRVKYMCIHIFFLIGTIAYNAVIGLHVFLLQKNTIKRRLFSVMCSDSGGPTMVVKRLSIVECQQLFHP